MIRFTFTIITLLFIATLSANESLLPPETVKLTPVKITPSDNAPLFQQSIIWHQKGKIEKRVGVGILIPSAIFATVSLASIAVSMIFIPSTPTYNDSDSSNSYGSWNLDFLFPTLFIPGIIGLIVNGSLMAVGIVKMKRGNRMMSEAKEMKKKANGVSFNVIPIITPKSKTYGVMLSMRY